MGHLTVRTVLAHRGRFALTVLAVMLAVAFVSGSLTLTDTSSALIEREFRTATAGIDLTVRTAAAFDSAMGIEVDRDPLGRAIVDRVRSVADAAEVDPVAEGQGLLLVDGAPIVPTGRSMLSTWVPAPTGSFTIRSGRAPTAPGEVVLDVATASAAGVTIGDDVVVTTDVPTTLRVVGLVGFGDSDGLPGATVALVSLPQAQRMLGLGEQVTELLVTVDGATASVQAAVRSELGSAYDVLSAQDAAAASADAAQQQLGGLSMVLTVMAGAAVLVGGLLIANTFAILIRQRRRQIALVRASGATGAQVTRGVLAEALLVGAVGSGLGTVLGIVVAGGLRAVLGAFGMALPSGAAVVSARTLGTSVALGVVMTLISAIGAARAAARVSPLEALRSSMEVTAEAPRRRRRVLIGVVLVAGLAGIGAVLAGGSMIALVPAVIGVVGGVVLLGPAVTPAITRVLGAPLARAGLPGELARQSTARAPRRTTATAMALALGLALIAFVTVVATSVREGLAGTYRETVTADLVVESARAEMLGGLSPAVAPLVDGVPEVAGTSRIRFGHWLDQGETSALAAVDPASLPEVANLDLIQGSLDGLTRGGVLVADAVARERGIRVGDVVTMTFSHTGDQGVPVVGILDAVDAQALSTSWVISLDTYARNYTEDVDASVLVRLAPGVSTVAGHDAIASALAGFPTAAVQDLAAAAKQRAAAVDQVLGLMTVLVALTVVIALLGITNTLALSVAERTREIGLLRAVGASMRHVRLVVLGEAFLVAALAAVLGLGMGTGLGTVAVRAIGRTAPLPLVMPVGQLLALLFVAVAAGLLAGVAPARRAARMEVLEAIAH